jgi:hypothetical protein
VPGELDAARVMSFPKIGFSRIPIDIRAVKRAGPSGLGTFLLGPAASRPRLPKVSTHSGRDSSTLG